MLLLVETGIIDKERVAELIEEIVEVRQEIAGVRESVVLSVLSISLLREIARSIAVASAPQRLVAS